MKKKLKGEADSRDWKIRDNFNRLRGFWLDDFTQPSF